jgi:aryl sulfotransferase
MAFLVSNTVLNSFFSFLSLERSLFDHVKTWWEARKLPNVLFVHYGDLLENTEKGIREIAAFLDIPVSDELMPGILQAVSFEGMRNNLLCIPSFIFEEGAKSFVNKGTNGRWKGVLTEDQLAKYDAKVKEKLTPECAAWLEHGNKGYISRN